MRRLVKDRRYRDAEHQAVIEGPRAIQTAIDFGADLREIFHRPDQSEVAETLLKEGMTIHQVDSDVLDQIAESGSPQGLLAVAEVHDAEAPTISASRRVVVVDSVQDPGNVGAIVRTAAAAGFEAVIASPGTADLLSPRSIRASAGTIFSMQFARNMELDSVMGALVRAGHLVVAADSRGEKDFRSLEVKDHMTLLLGSEAEGASEDALKHANLLVAIPMGKHVESLNVAVAGGLVMYQMQAIDND